MRSKPEMTQKYKKKRRNRKMVYVTIICVLLGVVVAVDVVVVSESNFVWLNWWSCRAINSTIKCSYKWISIDSIQVSSRINKNSHRKSCETKKKRTKLANRNNELIFIWTFVWAIWIDPMEKSIMFVEIFFENNQSRCNMCGRERIRVTIYKWNIHIRQTTRR